MCHFHSVEHIYKINSGYTSVGWVRPQSGMDYGLGWAGPALISVEGWLRAEPGLEKVGPCRPLLEGKYLTMSYLIKNIRMVCWYVINDIIL